jgi:FMN-dependent NADH-azoreductase
MKKIEVRVMKTLLQVISGIGSSSGHSAQLAEQYSQEWLSLNPGGRIVRRDFSVEWVPHLTAERFQAFATSPALRTPAQRELAEYSDSLIEEINSAEIVVFAVPMHNFSVPSTLRAYFDHIARAGVTFRYTADGPEGLVKGKKAYVFITRGGVYPEPADTQTPYIRQFLGFIGITDVRFVHAEGMGLGESAREQSLANARQEIAALLAMPEAA